MIYPRMARFVALLGVGGMSPALACPNCPTAEVVRASVWGGDFWHRLVMVLAPFLLMGFISALLYRVGEPETKS